MKLRLTTYTAHENAKKLHKSSAKTIVVIAPRRSGKSYSILHDAIAHAWNNPFPDSGILLSAPTLSQCWESLVEPTIRILSQAGLMKGHSTLKKKITLANNKSIYYRSLDIPDNVRGLTLSRAYVDEAAFVDQYAIQVIQPMLLTTDGSMVLVTTPKGVNNWFYKLFFENVPPANTEIIRYNIRDNPIITQDAIDYLYSVYDPRLIKQELEGEFINLSNELVYYSFNRDVNCFDTLPGHDGLIDPIYIFIDYNVDKNPALICKRSISNRFYILEEIYGERSVIDLGKKIISKFGRNVVIIDDAVGGNNRNQSTGKTNRQILYQLGLSNISNSISNPHRVERYNNLNAHFLNALNNPRVFIHKSCNHLISELESLVYRPGTDVPFISEHSRSDSSDALGYGIWKLSPNGGFESSQFSEMIRRKTAKYVNF